MAGQSICHEVQPSVVYHRHLYVRTDTPIVLLPQIGSKVHEVHVVMQHHSRSSSQKAGLKISVTNAIIRGPVLCTTVAVLVTQEPQSITSLQDYIASSSCVFTFQDHIPKPSGTGTILCPGPIFLSLAKG